MVSLRGRLQKEGQVIHVIVDRVVPRDLYSPPFANGVDPEDMIKVCSHDFR